MLLTSLALTATVAATYVFVPKEPYSLRQLHQGWSSYRQGLYDDSLQHFMRSVEADGSNADAHFARGRAFLRLGRYESALADFRAADELVSGSDGRIKACLGYCLNLLGHGELAIVSYNQAIDLDFSTEQVFNNLGYSYATWTDPKTKPTDCLDRAEACLTQALELNGQLQPAYYNRARVDLLRASINPRWLPRQGIADAHKAIELGPVSASLYWDAARLSCVLANRQGRQDPETLELMDAAVENGLDPTNLQKDIIFHDLAMDSRFMAILRKKPNPNLLKEAQKLADPIQN